MIYIQLIQEFFKIGIFSFGGGYATIPFLYHISEQYQWYSISELKQIIAIASITPGPVGINAATYAGLKTAGIAGSLLATISEVIPSLVLVLFISKALKIFNDNKIVKNVIESLKPISCALLASVAFGMLKTEIKSFNSIFLLGILILMSLKSKKTLYSI